MPVSNPSPAGGAAVASVPPSRPSRPSGPIVVPGTSDASHADRTGNRLWALVPCAGSGSRAGAGGAKQYRELAGRPLVAHTLAAFAGVARLAGVLVAVAPDDDYLDRPDAAALPPDDPRFRIVRCGGATRARSVAAGLADLRARGAGDDDWVLVHDAARCLVTTAQVDALIDACAGDAVGGLLAQPLADTLKRAGPDGRVAATVDRADKWQAQTPQMFPWACSRPRWRARATRSPTNRPPSRRWGCGPGWCRPAGRTSR